MSPSVLEPAGGVNPGKGDPLVVVASSSAPSPPSPFPFPLPKELVGRMVVRVGVLRVSVGVMLCVICEREEVVAPVTGGPVAGPAVEQISMIPMT